MQELVEETITTNPNINELPFEQKQRLIDVFVWLVQEDKKQNPELYQYKKQEHD